jgi:2-polyprenyl-3-methyl-5-hydroxy-6-metoxy-1,4-benzoquinol methylase
VSTFDRDTGRDRYFEARERELDALEPTRRVDCPLCGSSDHEALFAKHGFTFVRCSSCGLVFVNPQLEEEAVLEEYRTAATNDLWFDVLTSERQQELDRAKFAEVLDALEPYRGKLLDVGCSIGLFLHLAEERGWDVGGLEPAPRAREHARQEYGLEVGEKTLAEAGFPEGSFDAVALLSVLEHATEPLLLLRECARILRPGGALYVIVPNVESLACNVLGSAARTFDGRNHLVYFSSGTLPDALGRAGFEVVRTGTRVGSLGPVFAHAAGRAPYADEEHPLSAWLAAHGDELEREVEGVGLGYKLHCLATKGG